MLADAAAVAAAVAAAAVFDLAFGFVHPVTIKRFKQHEIGGQGGE